LRLAASALAAVAASLLLAACGSSGSKAPPPQGPPTLRHPAAEVDAARAAEEMRAQLVTASSLYGVGRLADSGAHMDTAAADYSKITDRVRRGDALLDHEIVAAFPVIAGQIARKQAAPAVENRMGLIQGQLLNAAITNAVSLSTRNDPTLAAQVTLDLATEGQRAYAQAGRNVGSPESRRAFQDSFGLFTRAIAVVRGIGPALGPQRTHAIGALGAAHNDGFPLGVLQPKSLQVAKVDADFARLKAALAKRFRVG
jgi:hypothetical protein